MASSGKHVAYYRVSTARQGRSGLGLEAQKKAVAEYLNGGGWKIVGEFTEVERGKRADRQTIRRPVQRHAHRRRAGRVMQRCHRQILTRSVKI